MKTTKITQTPQTITINGVSQTIPVRRAATVPVDSDALAKRVFLIIAATTVAGAMAWSTVAIGSLLSPLAPVALAYTIAIMFDLLWVALMILEWIHRYDPSKRRIPMVAGWGALIVSMSAVFTHGLSVSTPLIAGFGAVISLMAKSLWSLGMGTYTRRLSPEVSGWLKSTVDESYARTAATVASLDMHRATAHTAELIRSMGIETPAPAPVVTVKTETVSTGDADQTSVTPVPEKTVMPTPAFSDRGRAKADGVAALIAALRDRPLTIADAMEITGVPQSTAARWLAEARRAEGTGYYV